MLFNTKAKYKKETEKELADILGMSVNDFCSILDNIYSMVQTETAILSGSEIDIEYINAQIEKNKEIISW